MVLHSGRLLNGGNAVKAWLGVHLCIPLIAFPLIQLFIPLGTFCTLWQEHWAVDRLEIRILVACGSTDSVHSLYRTVC